MTGPGTLAEVRARMQRWVLAAGATITRSDLGLPCRQVTAMNDRSRPGKGGSDKTIAAVDCILPNVADIADAYVVVVFTPAGKYLRRVFLSLHSATAAIQRARKRGQPAEMILCRLVPVAADLDLDGEVTS